MEIISSKRFILLILATSSLLTSNIFCANELRISHHYSKENYDKYSEPSGTPNGRKERSINFQELKDWGPKNVIKTNTPAANKMPHSAANLPLRFGRTMKETRSPGETASLPLRFGRNMEASILRCVPNLPQRFGRMTTAKSVTKTLSDLLPRSMRSMPPSELLYSMTCQHQKLQNSGQKLPRRLIFKEIEDAKGKEEK
ncbi:PREDICTED: pro-FMRFamide-related neuropeptide VF [Dipodomys ordii]|uniref:Pro-FMRFamide-related neuropeptide VF n=1 Tax=Dipodomys ordii TaxID=10020 RepID=A0A1S3FV34_DIPOR|nr:PREDICTED: pro-FMRFamide-related neuropeptide VF [Dipodomys ordii]